jgi:hypothetical protein
MTAAIYPTQASATAAALRLGLPNTIPSAAKLEGGWVAVVKLRPDQMWMTPTVLTNGCCVGEAP